MNRARKLIVVGTALAAFAVAGVALASGVFTPVRDATERVPRRRGKAKAAGYSIRLPDLDGISCIESPRRRAWACTWSTARCCSTAGRSRRRSPRRWCTRAAERRPLKLAAVEYVVFKADWTGSEPPSLFGREFDLVDAAEPLRPAAVLRAARVDLARKPERLAERLEPEDRLPLRPSGDSPGTVPGLSPVITPGRPRRPSAPGRTSPASRTGRSPARRRARRSRPGRCRAGARAPASR